MNDDSLPSAETTEIASARTNETPTPHRNDDGRAMPAGKRWVKGQSGNPSGRPRVEPRVRRYARKYDRRMCRVLAKIAEDPKVSANERRKAAMDLVAIGSGRPAVIQEVGGRDGQPLVNLNIGSPAPGTALAPADAYKLMIEGALEPSAQHEAFVSSEKEPQ